MLCFENKRMCVLNVQAGLRINVTPIQITLIPTWTTIYSIQDRINAFLNRATSLNDSSKQLK